jgi:dGTP triphosphohydrolase
LITRIEQKVQSSEGQSFGLNLTRATLDACCKYPWTREHAVNDTGADRSIKFGVYEDDIPVFEWIRQGAPERLKCFEAQIMDFSDDVAYSVHDFEDAIVEDFIKLEELTIQANEDAIVSEIERWNGNRIPRHELVSAMNRLQANTFWLTSFSGEPAQAGQLKNLTSLVAVNNKLTKLPASTDWAQLTILNVSGNALTNLRGVETLPALEELDVSANQIKSVESLAAAKTLVRFYANDNQLDDLAPLAGLTNLEVLHIANNKVSDLRPLAKNSSLRYVKYLDFSNNPLSRGKCPIIGDSEAINTYCRDTFVDKN